MTIKHLPGKHNQKLHASRQSDKEERLMRVKDELRRKEKESQDLQNALRARGLKEVLAAQEAELAAQRNAVSNLQQQANARGIKTPTPIKAESDLRRKYGRTATTPHIGELATTGFEAVIATSKDNEDILFTDITDIADYDKTDAYIKDFIEIARSNHMRSAVFKDLPIEVAEEVGGVYKTTWTGLATMAIRSLIHLSDTYGLEVPKEFEATTGIFGKTTSALEGMDVPKVAVWLNTLSQLPWRVDPTRRNSLIVKVTDFHNVKHPNHPEVPLFTEYIYHSNDIPNVYVDLE